MRVKRQKCHRKSVRFYTSCFGFRQPFKVLCDGTFVHHLIANNIKPADTAISSILSAALVKLFTTRCVLAELKRLGNSYFQALEAAHQLFTASCDHEKIKSADVCITDVIGQNNPEHFFVATQDSDLQKKFEEIPGVPIIFGLRKSLFLKPLSTFQRQFVKTSEEARLHMTELDRKMLQKRSRNMSVDEEANNSSGENEDFVDKKSGIQDERKPLTVWEAMRVKDKVQFKRKKAKAPNPLSCKKKIREEPKLVLEKEKKDDKNSVRSRSRKRKRSHRGKKIAE